jgi:hypothetical protein
MGHSLLAVRRLSSNPTFDIFIHEYILSFRIIGAVAFCVFCHCFVPSHFPIFFPFFFFFFSNPDPPKQASASKRKPPSCQHQRANNTNTTPIYL